jgi:stringent starvation protein B
MADDAIPQQPYFLRALYEWCVDSGYTPYVTVKVGPGAKVPTAYVKDGQIVLNIGPAAVRNLHMDNDWLSFSARFGGVSQLVEVPIGYVLAIYAKESGEGMAFQASAEAPPAVAGDPAEQEADSPPPEPERPKGKPSLRVVK